MKITIEINGLSIAAIHGEGVVFEMDLAKGADREALLKALGLDPAAGILVVVNGTVASKGRRLSDRDRVSLFAPVIGG